MMGARYRAAVTAPKDVVIAIDTSGSLAAATKLDIIRDAALVALKSVSAYDYVAIVAFDDTSQQLCGASRGSCHSWKASPPRARSEESVRFYSIVRTGHKAVRYYCHRPPEAAAKMAFASH